MLNYLTNLFLMTGVVIWGTNFLHLGIETKPLQSVKSYSREGSNHSKNILEGHKFEVILNKVDPDNKIRKLIIRVDKNDFDVNNIKLIASHYSDLFEVPSALAIYFFSNTSDAQTPENIIVSKKLDQYSKPSALLVRSLFDENLFYIDEKGDQLLPILQYHSFDTNNGKWFVLKKAIQLDDLERVKLEIAHNFDINEVDKYGWGLLLHATKLGNVKVVNYLIENGVDINLKSTSDIPPLCLSISNAYTNIAVTLIKSGADVDGPDWLGRTPLIYAAMYNNLVATQALLEKEAKINQQNNDKQSPLIVAIDNQAKIQIIESLLNAGASMELSDSIGWTPLKYAIYKDNKEQVKLLLQYGAKIESPKFTESPFSLARRFDRQEILNLLEQYYKK